MENFNDLKQRIEDLEEEKFNKQSEIDDLDTEIEEATQLLQYTFNKDKDNANAVLNAETINLLKKLAENINIYNQMSNKCSKCYYAEDCDYIDESDKGTTCNLIEFADSFTKFIFSEGWEEFLSINGINFSNGEDE